MQALQHWGAQPLVGLFGVTLVWHELGCRRLARRGTGRRTPRDLRRQGWLFRGGIGWAALTLVSPLGYWSHELLFARVGLDLSFACLVAPLFVLGAPWSSLGALAPPFLRRTRDVHRAPGGAIAGIGAFLGVVAVWQVPQVLDPSVHVRALWALQVVCYLVAGILLWLQLVGSYPLRPDWGPVHRLGLIAASLWAMWIAGLSLVIAGHVRYPAFVGGPGTPLSKAMDQGVAGAIACVLPLIPLGIAAMWCFSHWLSCDEDEARLQEMLRRSGPGVAPPTQHPAPG